MMQLSLRCRQWHPRKPYCWLILLICALLPMRIYPRPVPAQNTLEMHISIRFEKQSLHEAIKKLERESRVRFTFNSNDLRGFQVAAASFTDKPLGHVIAELMKDTHLTASDINNSVVIHKKETAPPGTDAPPKEVYRITIAGKITDERNMAIPGVSVSVKGTRKGTLSDAEGHFKIDAEKGEVLLFSFIGYEQQEVIVGDRSSLEVILKQSTKSLGEVVVTALGIVKNSKTLTYAAQKINGAQLNEVRDASFMSALSGKIAGAVVNQAAAGPGSAVRVVLRGNRSISGNNNALIVVDGVPVDNSTPQGQIDSDRGGYNGSDGAANINPDDVESVNVLKGAAATALYGSRAANGAIIITTKKGTAGKLSVNYNGGISADKAWLMLPFQNVYGRGNGGKTVEGAAASWGGKTQTYPDNVKDFFHTAISVNNAVSAATGSEKIQAYTSYANNYSEGIIPENKLYRNTLSLRINTQLTSKLSTDAKISYVNQEIKNKPVTGEIGGTSLMTYIMPRDMSSTELKDYETINEGGQPVSKYWTTSSVYTNPYWNIHRTSYNERRDRVTLLGSVKYEFTPWLNVQARYSLDRYNDKIKGSYYGGTIGILPVTPKGGRYFETNGYVSERNIDVLVSGNNKLTQDVGITYNIGGNILRRQYETSTTSANGLQVPNKFNLIYATSLDATTQFTKRELQSVYGSVQFDFRKYLFLDVSARNDWSSTLPSPYAYFYPSVGLSALISDMTQLPSWISFAKVRASYTRVGNDAIPYLLIQPYSYAPGASNGFISRDATKAISDLKPELTSSWEFGIDWRFLDGRIGIDGTFYKTNTINQLLFLALPPASGFSNQYINAGNIENRGIEITLTADPVRSKKFNWNTTVNFSRNINKVLELSPDVKEASLTGSKRLADVVVKEGGSYGDMYGSGWATDPKTGAHLVNAKGLPEMNELQYLGNFNPDFSLGWSNTFSYGPLSLSFLLDGRVGGTVISGTDANLAFYGLGDFTLPYREGGWVLPGVYSNGRNNTTDIKAEDFWTTVSGGRYAWGQFFAYDATNFRLREVALGYEIPLHSKFIKHAKVSLTGRNLFFLYRGKSRLDIPGIGKRKIPFDPDMTLGAGNFQGIESGTPPALKSFGVNVKLSF